MIRPILYLFIGYPGSGKTTVARLIHGRTGAVHLWADHERQAMFERVTHSKAESEQLYNELNKRTAQLLSNGKSVIFDTNFNYAADRQRLRDIATAHNAQTIVIWLQTPVELAKDRALHADHRDKNNYQDIMTAEQFSDLICRLEPPTNDELFITIDGTDIDKSMLARQLEL